MVNEDRKAVRALIWVGVPFLVLAGLVVAFMIANRPPVVNVPSHKMPKPNGWDDLIAAGHIATSIRAISTGPYSDATKQPRDWTITELQSWVVQATPALDMVRKGLTKECMHPAVRDWGSMSVYPGIREMARVLAGESLYYGKVGKPAKAAESLLDGVEMGVETQRGATFIGGLVGCAVQAITIRHLEPLLPKLSPEELARIATRMQKISSERVPYGDVLIEESRFAAVWSCGIFNTKGQQLSAALDVHGDFIDRSKGDPSTFDRVKHSAGYAFINKAGMIADNRDYLETLAKEQRGPYTGRSKVPIPQNPLSASYGRTFVAASCSFVRDEAIFAVLQTEVALLRYRAGHGRYPDTLAELAPVYLKRVPIDPFGLGKPLRYHPLKDGKSYLLYSLGPDMKDDHGSPILQDYILSDSLGDIVAGSLSHDKP